MYRPLMLIAVLATSLAGAAEPAPTGVVAYREAGMKAIASHFKSLSMIAKGEVDRPQDAVGHATAIAAMARDLAAQFPAGSGPDKVKTEARAEVWSKRAEFEAAARAFEAETMKLVEVAVTGDKAAIQAQIGNVGQSCGSCHDAFRVKD
ncbi:MAG TPA: cytochrome c [Myxococcota bacterium]|nr:cytochrome c [Myxococcota bacterium]